MPIDLINPMDETPRSRGKKAPRIETLAGLTVGLLDISKPGGNHFLDRIERDLRERYGVAHIVRETKPTFTRPAPMEVLMRFVDASCAAVVEALAD